MAITETKTNLCNSMVLEFTGGLDLPTGWTTGFKITNKFGASSTIVFTESSGETMDDAWFYLVDQANNVANLSSLVKDVQFSQQGSLLSISTSDDQPFSLEVTHPTCVIESYLPVGSTWCDDPINRTPPDLIKRQLGWVKGERPKMQWWNSRLNLLGNISEFLTTFVAGVKTNVVSLWQSILSITNNISEIEDDISEIIDYHIPNINTAIDDIDDEVTAIKNTNVMKFIQTINYSYTNVTDTLNLPIDPLIWTNDSVPIHVIVSFYENTMINKNIFAIPARWSREAGNILQVVFSREYGFSGSITVSFFAIELITNP